MKLGGGLNYVTGPMGAGKTLYAVRRIVAAVTAGQYAVTNVELRPDAFERIARHLAPFSRDRQDLERRLRSRYVFTDELHQALKYRLRGHGEARGLFVWDEGQNDLNNRDWRDEGRLPILKWATQLRKLGFVGFLLSQHADNTDAALRRVCSYHVRLQNQREQTRLLGVRVTPVPLFLAYWYPAHLGGKGQAVPPTKVERYFLSWHRHLYDTLGLYHGLAGSGDDDVIVLGGERPPVLVAEPQADAGAAELPTRRTRPTGGVVSLPVNEEGPPVTATLRAEPR